MSVGRPRVKVARTATEQAVELVALAGMVALVAIAASGWQAAKGLVPTHFGADGRADAWGGRGSLLLLPAVGLVLYASITVLSRYPHQFNYAVEITAQNAAAQYRNARSMMVWLKAEIVWLFAYIAWQSIPASGAGGASLGIAFLPLAVVAVFLTMTAHLRRMYQLR